VGPIVSAMVPRLIHRRMVKGHLSTGSTGTSMNETEKQRLASKIYNESLTHNDLDDRASIDDRV
jgi:hypothetical protein